MHSFWLDKVQTALDADRPLKLEQINAAPPVAPGVARALFDFFETLAEDYRSAFFQSETKGRRAAAGKTSRCRRPPSLQRLVRERLDLAVDEFTKSIARDRRNSAVDEFVMIPSSPLKLSVYAKHGAKPVADRLSRFAAKLEEYDCSDPAAAATLDVLDKAFKFINTNIALKSQRVMTEYDPLLLSKRRTMKGDLEYHEQCQRCEAWTERYADAIIPLEMIRGEPRPVTIRLPGSPHEFRIEMHRPLPSKVIRHDYNDKFCIACRRKGSHYLSSLNSEKEFLSVVDSPKLTEMLHDLGIRANSTVRRRIASFLVRPTLGKNNVEAWVKMLKINSAQLDKIVQKFFGVPLSESLGLAAGEISHVVASKGGGLSTYNAVRREWSNISVAIDHRHAKQAIEQALEWSKTETADTDLSSVELGLPELGLVLNAAAGEFWSIEAYIDRPENYDWMPAHWTAEKSARSSAAHRKRRQSK